MGPRAALTIAVALALAGCDGGSYGYPPTDMGSSGADMGAPACTISIVALDSNNNPTMNAPATLYATANVTGQRGAHWTVMHAGDAAVTPMSVKGSEYEVEYAADLPGSWTFSVKFDTGCEYTQSKTLDNPTGVSVD